MEKVRPALLRGFDQEYLPHEQLQFNHLLDIIRRNFELYGFLPIETPSAERAEVLTSKGGAEKEIYALKRLAAGAEEDEAAAKGALRFDLTVPLARYVAMRERELAFPFRRYQIQRVWRGETPQAKKGRFREFYQCDIDIINRDKLSYLAEAEIPSVVYRVFREMAIGEFRIRLSNRKLLRGLLQSFRVPEQNSNSVLRALDKVEKEDGAAVQRELTEQGLASGAARGLYDLVAVRKDTKETFAVLAGIAPNEALQAGVAELQKVVAAMGQLGVPEAAFAVDLSVVRGLDYYTGTIYETRLVDHPDIGSICSGGRYDDLASYFTDTRLPGVGISIGLTRLFAKLSEAGLLRPLARTPAEAIVVTMDERFLNRYLEMATKLRDAGINTEVYLEQAKLRNQMAYADRKGFRVAVIAGEDEFARHTVQIKNLATQQATVHPLDDVVGAVRATLNEPVSNEPVTAGVGHGARS
jgi:histidyl-tRNA synthetase